MKFNKSFFDSSDTSNFRLWQHVDETHSLKGEILLQSQVLKRSRKGDELVKRFFFITQNAIYYKKAFEDHKVRGMLKLDSVRLEYQVPEGFEYPPQDYTESINSPYLNRKMDDKAKEEAPKDELTKNLFIIKFVRNLKFTELYFDEQDSFFVWMDALKNLVIQTDFHERYNVIE
jgi:hypothetical protein